jgi:predicted enzyme related to lactoylglutathione lyase
MRVMPERTSYEPGTPNWVDLGTSDPDAAKAFYRSLFGWEAEDAGPVEETGGYAFFTLNGRKVAAVNGLMDPNQPVAWSTYIATDDVDGLTERAKAGGAQAVVEPMAIMDVGRMAFYMHPSAGAFGAWEAGTFAGAEFVNDPGSLSWNELHTRDRDGAKRFGEAVFGWTFDDNAFGGDMGYTIVNVGENGVGGMMDMPPGVPEEVPAYWMTVFAVGDCDAAADRVTELGGTVVYGPSSMEGVGRFAYANDPQGATFGIIENATPAE